MKKLLTLLSLAVTTTAFSQSIVDQANGYDYWLDIEFVGDTVVVVDSDEFYKVKLDEIVDGAVLYDSYNSWMGIHAVYLSGGHKYIFTKMEGDRPDKVAIYKE